MVSVSKSGVLAEPALAGRENELEELQCLLKSAIEGKGKTVFISGEAGSGKTRLVEEFLQKAGKKNVAVLSGWCLGDIAVPYFPFMEAFNAYFSEKGKEKIQPSISQSSGVNAKLCTDEESEIEAWLKGPKEPGKTDKLQNLTPQAWQDLTVAAVTKALLSISDQKTVILFIDDLQWADSASLSLLHYISRSIRLAKVLVLGTFRSEELSPIAGGRPHPLIETLRLMNREELFKEIKLPSLDPATITNLAEQMVGGSLYSELAARLTEESHGNPLFVVESLRMLSENGSLIQDSGHWRLSIDEVGIPTKIKDIILRRVGMLKPNQRRILDLASVIGEKFDVELLGEVLGQDSLEVLEALSTVEQATSLVSCEGNLYQFDHAKSREAIYEEISPALRKGYHARIAEKMKARSKNEKDVQVSDLAYHYLQAGNKEKALQYALAAGEDALARFSNAEAVRQFTYVLNTLMETPEHSDEKAVALEGLGDALNAMSLFVEATKKYQQLSETAELGVVKLRALRKAVLSSYWSDNRMHALELAGKADAYAQSDRLEYARLCAQRAFVEGRMGKTKEAFEDAEAALKVFEEEYSLPDVARVLVDTVLLYMDVDQIEDEFAAALRALALFKEFGDLRGQMLAYDRIGFIFGIAAHPKESRYYREEGLKIAEKVGDNNLIAMNFIGKSGHYEYLGDLRAAVANSLKGVEFAEKTDAYFALLLLYTQAVRQYAMLGEIEKAEEIEERFEKLLQKVAGPHPPEAQSARATLLAAKSQFKEANEIFEKTIKSPTQGMYGTMFYGIAKSQYAWVLAKQGRIKEAQIQMEERRIIREEFVRRLEHADAQAFIMTKKEIGVAEELPVRLDLVNVATNRAVFLKIEGLIPPEFKVTKSPSYCTVRDDFVELNNKELSSSTVETLKFSFQAKESGVFILNPRVFYINALGETMTCFPRAVTVTVRSTVQAKIGDETISVPILPDRVPTGFMDLDVLLFGGIPQNYSVMLSGSSSDEKELLIKRFLTSGTTAHATTLYLTIDPENVKELAKEYPMDFYLFVCNSRADALIEDAPNIFKLKGVENLTEIDITLNKVFRNIETSKPAPKRACIDIISDILLQHHSVTTRKWLSGVLADLRTKGFTTLVTINPKMHSPEEVQAILGLFEGEIDVSERETTKGLQHILRIRKLRDQKFLTNELIINKEIL